MSEMRQDPTTREWVIMASERNRRPSDFARSAPRTGEPTFLSSCPFCPGNEHLTPPASLTIADPATGLWRVKAMANKYPAVTPGGDTSRKAAGGFFRSMEGSGIHEVFVETPIHNRHLHRMDEGEVEAVLQAWQQRYQAVARIPAVKSIIIFRNHGAAAGTSLEHPHSQMVATAIVPRHIRNKYEVAVSYYDDHGHCLYSDLAARELAAGTRVIMDTERYLVFHPFASHRPFETWIMPKAGRAGFDQAAAEDIEHLARVLRSTLRKLHRALDDPDFNLIIDSAPVGEERADYYQWHVKIVPRITEAAGFEIGSGMFINTALPEETARSMRDLPA